MPKGSNARIDETVEYIVSQVPGGEQATIRSYLNDRVAHMSVGGDVHNISDPMSMNDLVNRGTEDERKIRRSVMLIETVALTAAAGAPAAKTQAVPALTIRFNGLVEAVRLLADQDRGTANLLQAKFRQLQANPLGFLQNNLLLVFGSNTDGVMNQYFVFEYSQGVPKFKFVTARPGTATHCYTASVVNVPAILWSHVPGRTNNANAGSFAGIVGTRLNLANTMVTTQFSGCSFCFKEHGGSVYAAHIWPDDANVPHSAMPAAGGHGGGTRLARQLAGLAAPGVTGGGFAAPAPAGGVFQVYGPGYSNVAGRAGGYPVRVGNDWMTLIGVNMGGHWRLFSQHVVNGAIHAAVQVH